MDGAPQALSEPLLPDDSPVEKSEEANSDATAVAETDPQHDEALADRAVAGGALPGDQIGHAMADCIIDRGTGYLR